MAIHLLTTSSSVRMSPEQLLPRTKIARKFGSTPSYYLVRPQGRLKTQSDDQDLLLGGGAEAVNMANLDVTDEAYLHSCSSLVLSYV